MRGKSPAAENYFQEVLNHQKLEELDFMDRMMIYAFISEGYFRLGGIQKSLAIAEENLQIYNKLERSIFDWPFDWFVWIKMRAGRYYYENNDFEKAERLYGEIIDSGFFEDINYVNRVFLFNLFFEPKPFPVEKEKIIEDFKIVGKILTRYFPEREKEALIFKNFSLENNFFNDVRD